MSKVTHFKAQQKKVSNLVVVVISACATLKRLVEYSVKGLSEFGKVVARMESLTVV
jgi:hypothetical protein